MATGQGELALTLEFDSITNHLSIKAIALLLQDSQKQDIMVAYISLCDIDSPSFHNLFPSDTYTIDLLIPAQTISFPTVQTPLAVYTGKKYKPVAIKVQPVETELPSQFRIMHDIKGDPLKDMLVLTT